MNKQAETVYVAVFVARGFVSEIRAYNGPRAARRQERAWRRKMNPDYDETGWACVNVRQMSDAKRQSVQRRKQRDAEFRGVICSQLKDLNMPPHNTVRVTLPRV